MEPTDLKALAALPYRPRRIVCPFDLADEHHTGLQAAFALAERLDAELRVVYVLHSPVPPPVQPGEFPLPDLDQQWRDARGAAEDSLESLLAEYSERYGVDAALEIVVGIHYKEIVRYAEEVAGDLIVMSTHGRHGLQERLLGSTAERIVRLVNCPVLTVPPEAGELEPRRVVVATDFSPFSDEALPVVRFIADVYDPEITLAHVLPAYRNPAILSQAGTPPILTREWRESWRESAHEHLAARARLVGNGGRTSVKVLESGDAGKEIVAFAEKEKADLIISGTRGSSGLDRILLGSTAEEIVRRAHCATLTVTPDYLEHPTRREEDEEEEERKLEHVAAKGATHAY
ncbi:MAG: universal stress protein [Acidobacteriota bacterium]|jgi:nucleotide-binding universal stress UspA family protein